MPNEHTPGLSSLAAARMGQRVEVKGILFTELRVLCRELGLQEGDVVRCRFDGLTHKILEAPSGRTIVLEHDWARFIQVCALGAQPSQSPDGNDEPGVWRDHRSRSE